MGATRHLARRNKRVSAVIQTCHRRVGVEVPGAPNHLTGRESGAGVFRIGACRVGGGLVRLVRMLLVPSANAAGPSKGSSSSENAQAELLDGGAVVPLTCRLSLALKLRIPLDCPFAMIFRDPTAVPQLPATPPEVLFR